MSAAELKNLLVFNQLGASTVVLCGTHRTCLVVSMTILFSRNADFARANSKSSPTVRGTIPVLESPQTFSRSHCIYNACIAAYLAFIRFVPRLLRPDYFPLVVTGILGSAAYLSKKNLRRIVPCRNPK